jgi:hypothetical protein
MTGLAAGEVPARDGLGISAAGAEEAVKSGAGVFLVER